MSNEIIKVLDELAKRFGLAIDWTQKNIMPYITDLNNRVVNYSLTTSILWLIFLGIIGFIAYKMLIKAIKSKRDMYGDIKIEYGMLGAFSGVGIAVSCLLIIINLINIIKCILLPELIILNILKSLGM